VDLNFLNDEKHFGYVRALGLRSNRRAGYEIGDKNATLWKSPIDISLQDNSRYKIYNKLFRTLFLSSQNARALVRVRWTSFGLHGRRKILSQRPRLLGEPL
jgi:hypothetical protein